jgi:hypothetical protein
MENPGDPQWAKTARLVLSRVLFCVGILCAA